jgi:hypothetical protein
MPVPSAEISAWTSVFCRTRSMRAFSTLRILPRIGRIAWNSASRPPLAGAAGGVALDDVELALLRVGPLAVGQLAGQAAGLEQPLAAAGQVAGLARGHARARGGDRLAQDVLALAGVLLEPLAEPLVAHGQDEVARLGVAELGLGLPLELRLAELDGDDRGQAFADVVAGQPVLALLDQAPVLAELVDQRGERGAEALLVRAALVGVDGVGEGVDRLVEAGVPLHRHLERQLAVGVLGLERDHRLVRGALGGVEVVDEVDEPAVVLVADLADGHLAARSRGLVGGRHPVRALVAQGQAQPAVEEGHLAEARAQRLEGVVHRLEDVLARPVGDRRAGLVGRLAADQLGRGHADLEGLPPDVPLALDLDLEPARERVDDRDADAVQAAGHGVPAAAELAAGVQDGQHDGDGGLALAGDDVDRDARPLSRTRTPPSASSVTSMRSQWPASASSTELSTTS